ncbi:hypothetical protein CBD41_09740 [bacterium TMED181]|nr:hypothetical protein [Planctomycetota bacterium]OUW42067.1 MAG: hypothetical protein CBD41_09740 [bacterium TMED181]
MNPEHFCLLVAIWEIFIGSALLLNREKFLLWVEKVSQNTSNLRVFISAWLAIGALAVSKNPYPEWSLLGVLSVLAWAMMIKCAFGVLHTDRLIKWSLSIMQKAPPGIGIVVLAIGGSLIYAFVLLQS